MLCGNLMYGLLILYGYIACEKKLREYKNQVEASYIELESSFRNRVTEASSVETTVIDTSCDDVEKSKND